MRYKYKCSVTAHDCWLLYMNRIYHSMVGVCSLVFAASMIALTVRFWAESSIGVRVLLIAGCLLVPVVQPLGTYLRARRQAAQIPSDLELWFGDAGIYVQTGGKTENIGWKTISRVAKDHNMVIILTGDGRGYLLPNRVLGADRDAFYQYLASRISK